VTIHTLKALGIKWYCYVNPNETLVAPTSPSLFHTTPAGNNTWTPCKRGGFIYLYDSKLEPHPHDCYFTAAEPQSRSPLSGSNNLRPFSLVVQAPVPPPLRSSAERVEAADQRRGSAAEEPEREHLCVVCMEKTVGCIFWPCRHICTCPKCGSSIKSKEPAKCPMCREQIKEAWDVFL